MANCNRRQFIQVGGAGLAGLACGCSAFAQPRSHAPVEGDDEGCWLPADRAAQILRRVNRVVTFSQGDEQIEPRSGNPQLDRALARSLARLSRMFEVLPAFGYYQERGGANAKASAPLSGSGDGTVLFGLKLLQELLNGEYRADASIVAVCAHEFGHIVSFKNGMISQLAPGRNPFRAEQFADYMAGYFSGRRKRESPGFPAATFAATQHSFGGGDHGNRLQRGAAVQQGFSAAFQRNLSLSDATSAGFDYAMAQTL
jgi:hypothetical protein